ncbi:MAG: glycosyltransferase family 39 protein [Calditrichaeota bacterium]|nr:glycosyltransferase family 39 protein [Calditrichota bacterium]
MDAKLLMDGLLPVADFGSRQPFYVFMLSVFLKIFGMSYLAGRLLPIVSSLGIGWMLYLIGRRMFDSTVGLISAAIYLFLPLTIIWAPVVKTEPLAVFLGCIAVYFLVLSLDSGIQRSTWMIPSGIFAALAFYVRQPTLYLPLAIVTFTLFLRNVRVTEMVQRIFFFLMGYLSVTVGMIAVFLNKMSLRQVLFSQLNPLNLIWNRVLHIFNLVPAEYRIVDSSGFRILDQDRAYTFTAWHQSLFFCLFILVAALLAVLFLARKRREEENDKNSHWQITLMALWFGYVLLLYAYQSANRGFYTQYFTEALPPLILLAAVFIKYAFSRFNSKPVILFLWLGGSFYTLFIAQRMFWQFYPGIGGYLVAFTFLAALTVALKMMPFPNRRQTMLVTILTTLVSSTMFYLLKLIGIGDVFAIAAAFVLLFPVAQFLFNKWGRKEHISAETSAGVFVLLVSFWISAAFSGRMISPGYEAVWSRSVVKQVTAVLKHENEGTGEVLSGGMIWTFESGLTPFLNVSHPTEFFKKRKSDFVLEFTENRPPFIVLDGYTQRKFARYWTFIQGELDKNYELIAKVPHPKSPVKIYKLSRFPLYKKSFYTDNMTGAGKRSR